MSELRKNHWFLAAIFLVLAGAVGHNGFLGTLGLGLLIVTLLAWLWARFSLRGVIYARTLSTDRLYAGESLDIEVSLTNDKPLPLPWLSTQDRFDRQLIVSGAGRLVRAKDEWQLRRRVSAGPYERLRWKYHVECPRRGYYMVGPAFLRSGDPFSFYESEQQLTQSQALVVYPRVLPLEDLGLSRRFPFEASRSARGVIDDPLNIVGARPYAEGDTLRQVHWRASARSVGLQSKVWRPTQEASVLILLNLASSKYAWEELDVEAVERAISAAAAVVQRAHAVRWAFGLYVNGLQPGTRQRIRTGLARGDNALGTVMETLAKLPTYATMQFADLLRAERGRIPYAATIVVITAIVTPEVDEQLEVYRRAGKDVFLLDVGQPPYPRLRAEVGSAR